MTCGRVPVLRRHGDRDCVAARREGKLVAVSAGVGVGAAVCDCRGSVGGGGRNCDLANAVGHAVLVGRPAPGLNPGTEVPSTVRADSVASSLRSRHIVGVDLARR